MGGGGIAALPTGSIVLLVLYDLSLVSELKLNIPIPDICNGGIGDGATTDVGDAVKHESDPKVSPSLVVWAKELVLISAAMGVTKMTGCWLVDCMRVYFHEFLYNNEKAWICKYSWSVFQSMSMNRLLR